ncbi:MAG: hypothetical protein EOO09_12710 [Chitinophagaceae bacterium]|nr:MAG: hypothetical protein EOO09_12710 [Chitinophagaceae bacterium]
MKKQFLSAAVILLLLCSTNTVSAQKKTRSTYSYEMNGRDGETVIHTTEDNQDLRIRMKNEKILELVVDGNTIPESDYPKYEARIKKILEQLEKDRAQAEKDRAQAAKDRAQAEIDRKQAEKDRAGAEKDREQAMRDRQTAEKDRANAERDRDQADKDRANAGKHREEAGKRKEEAALERQQAEKDRDQAVKDREQAEKDREQAGKDRAQAELDRKQADKDRAKAAEHRRIVNELTDELVSDKIVGSNDELLNFTLNKSEMTVNGVKQPDAVYQKFSSKYLKQLGNHIIFSKNGNSRNINIL